MQRQLILLVILPLTSYASNRIIGGSLVSISSYPYQLSLRRNGSHICGASILSENIAISAAHCFPTNSPYSIKAGVDDLNETGVVIHVREAMIHPKYSQDANDFDIALLFLSSKLEFGKTIAAVALPKLWPTLRAGTVGRVSGWGVTTFPAFEPYSTKLHAVELPVWGWQECERAYPGVITPRQICIGLQKGGKDSCSGDSGGPFVVEGVLYGIVSAGMDCAEAGYPGIYTNVQALRRFIREYAGI